MSPLKPPRGFTASSPLRKFKVGALGHKKERRGNGEVNKRDIDQEGCEGGGGGQRKRRGEEREVWV